MTRPKPAEEGVEPVALSRWQGGKRWLVELHADRIPLPKTLRGRFFDVFTGSAPLAIHALKKGHRVMMGDTNPRLISAYAHLQSDPRAVVNSLRSFVEEYEEGVRDGTTGSVVFYRLRDRLNATEPFTLESAALTDANDADVGQASAAGIDVNLGTIAGGTNKTVTFNVKID